MPPKRKRAAAAEETPATTRSTRSSAKVAADVANVEEELAPTKKPKTTPKTKAAPKAKAAANNDGGGSSKAKDLKSTKPKPPATDSTETYTPQRALELFDSFSDPDAKDVIGPEGFTKLCEDAEIPLEGVQPILLSWLVSAGEMAKLTRDEWAKGMENLRISALVPLRTALIELEDLVVMGKESIKRSSANGHSSADPYNRVNYWKYAADPKTALSKFYQFCFTLVKPEQSRNIDMETAVALWSVILPPRYPIVNEIIEFVQEKGTFKAVNKDLWSMMLEFCQTVSPTLENYDADGAWPTLLDNFVEWKRAKSAMSG